MPFCRHEQAANDTTLDTERGNGNRVHPVAPFLFGFDRCSFPAVFQQSGGITDTWWILLILLVDVAHVYSTLYRTYFDPAAYKSIRTNCC